MSIVFSSHGSKLAYLAHHKSQSPMDSNTASIGSSAQPSAAAVLIHNEGPIRLLEMAHGWDLIHCICDDAGSWIMKSFRPIANDAVELRLYCRSHDQSGSVVTALASIAGRPLDGQARVLETGEIVQLQELMGPLIGNNQYTNPNPRQSRCAPDVHLVSVQVEQSGLRRVLCAEGIVLERNGKAALRFRNYYARGGHNDRCLIYELLLQAPLNQFDPFATQLRAAVLSMQWR